MEIAPLTAAHTLARSAFAAKDPSVSTRCHDDAATKFSEAAKETYDAEALRILKLLEDHHHQLARIVKTHPESTTSGEPKNVEATDATQKEDTATTLRLPNEETKQQQSSSQEHRPPRPVSPGTSRRPARELSSSIAHNLASARGIPPVPKRGPRGVAKQSLETIPAASDRDIKSTSQDSTLKASNTQLATGTSESPMAAQNQSQPKPEGLRPESSVGSSDDAFRKFYAGFEGLLTKLSAPLAFAGLPLVPEESASSVPEIRRPGTVAMTNNAPASEPPDVNSIFSKAALRAARENNGTFGGVHESFYVVPTGGGTVSYAGMLSKEGRRRSSLAGDSVEGEGADQFVDAHETPQKPNPRAARAASNQRSPNTNKTFEELEVENSSLKQLTDNLSRRLYMWEKSAQSQGFALQQSMRLLQQHSPESSNDGKTASKDKRLAELEEQMRVMQKELDKQGRENEKLKTVVARYRERWEKLKEGARRRESSGAGKGGIAEPVARDD